MTLQYTKSIKLSSILCWILHFFIIKFDYSLILQALEQLLNNQI